MFCLHIIACQAPEIFHKKRLCHASTLQKFASEISYHHWYLTSYLSNKETCKLKQELQDLTCNPGLQSLQITAINPKINRVHLIGIYA